MATAIVSDNSHACNGDNAPLSGGIQGLAADDRAEWKNGVLGLKEIPEDHVTIFNSKLLETVLFGVTKCVLEGDKESAHQYLMHLVDINYEQSKPEEFWNVTRGSETH